MMTPAWTTHLAWTHGPARSGDPLRGRAHAGLEGRDLTYALDESLGGPGDDLAPGDLLCAAVAQCFDATVRRVARGRGVPLATLTVIVTGDVDARGALGHGEAPVGLQTLRLQVHVGAARDVPAEALAQVLAEARRRSQILQTVAAAVELDVVVVDDL